MTSLSRTQIEALSYDDLLILHTRVSDELEKRRNRVSVEGMDWNAIEWVDFPRIALPGEDTGDDSCTSLTASSGELSCTELSSDELEDLLVHEMNIQYDSSGESMEETPLVIH
jgi:hypothetical protein